MRALVGRRDAVAVAAKALATAGGRVGHGLAFSGDPDVGTSRLASECAAMAAERDFWVLRGAAGPPPAGSVVRACGRGVVAVGGSGSPRAVAQARGPAVEARLLFDGLPVEVPAQLADARLERLRSFEAVGVCWIV